MKFLIQRWALAHSIYISTVLFQLWGNETILFDECKTDSMSLYFSRFIWVMFSKQEREKQIIACNYYIGCSNKVQYTVTLGGLVGSWLKTFVLVLLTRDSEAKGKVLPCLWGVYYAGILVLHVLPWSMNASHDSRAGGGIWPSLIGAWFHFKGKSLLQ